MKTESNMMNQKQKCQKVKSKKKNLNFKGENYNLMRIACTKTNSEHWLRGDN